MSRKNLKTLDDVKEMLLKQYEKKHILLFDEVEKATSHLSLDDTETEDLHQWFIDHDITLAEEEGEEIIPEEILLEADAEDDVDDVFVGDDEDEDTLFDDSMNKVDLSSYENELTNANMVRINDPVKMYLKEIGRVNLLDAKDEPEIARRLQNGEEAHRLFFKMYRETYAPEASDEVFEEFIEGVKIEDVIEQLREVITDEAQISQINNYEHTYYDGMEARRILISANLRLVVSIAKKYVGRGMLFLDLIQEGNMGLVKAVEKFDYTKGFKFSTYATWWIRQAITRAIADQARTIRIPVHMVETINKLTRIQRSLVQSLGREPSAEEIAAEMENMTPEKVREIQKIALDPVSLETPIGEEDDSHLGDFIEDKDAMSPDDYANNQLLKEEINMVLEGLTEREEKVLRLRFGLEDGRTRTLEEVGREFNVTRERIRQIEAKALRKLKHPTRSKRLRDFVDKK